MACAGVVEHFSGARFSSDGFGRGSWMKKFFLTIIRLLQILFKVFVTPLARKIREQKNIFQKTSKL